MGVWGRAPVGFRGKSPLGESARADDTFVKMCYFEPVLRCMHDYMSQFNTKRKKNQFGGTKVVGQATVLTRWAHKVGRAAVARPAK